MSASFKQFSISMISVQLVGDYVKERFVLASQLGRISWAESTPSLDRPGGVFQTSSLLTTCFKNVRLLPTHLPPFVPECPDHDGEHADQDATFFWQMFEVDPATMHVIRILQRRLLKREAEWSIQGQLHKLAKERLPSDSVLFVEQEDYTGHSRVVETKEIFSFAAACGSKFLLKTNKPQLALEVARSSGVSTTTTIVTTLRALEGNSLNSHTWDGVVRHVMEKLGELPPNVRMAVELWNEGCIWLNGSNGVLFWDIENPLGAQRLGGKGWLPGLMNVTCACLLSRAQEAGWPNMNHVLDSWRISRQCGLLDPDGSQQIVDLPMRLQALLAQEAAARPRASGFGVAEFSCPLPSNWSFLSGLRVDEALIECVAKSGKQALRTVNCPFLSLGKLFEIEETKIEQLLKLNHLLRDYASRRLSLRPLSIAILGPAGTGKSFAVAELATSANLWREPVFLSYNLSQFRSAEDLVPAFHAVQSHVLRGKLPFVFWDEFDADFNRRPLGWLEYFLGPMQDGEFFVHGQAHPLGRCVFIFAGSTSSSYEEFRNLKEPGSVAAKLPDFVSRIKAWLDMSLGRSSEAGGGLLRAMAVHALFKRHAPHVLGSIDRDAIKYLLSDLFPTMRDIERAIESSALSDMNRFTTARFLFKPSIAAR
jgi:hypothetical protein